MIRVLIIEDEQSSAHRLKRLLEASAISCLNSELYFQAEAVYL